MTNERFLISLLSTNHIYVAIYHHYLHMVFMSQNSFDTLEHILDTINFWVEASYLQISSCCRVSHSRLKVHVAIRKFCGRYNDLVCLYNHLSLSQMVSDMLNTSWHWIRLWMAPFTWYGLLAHGRCDRSTGDAYSS